VTPVRERTIVTLALALPVAAVIVSAMSLGPAARRMPLVVALPTLALLMIELIRARRSTASPSDRPLEPRVIAWLSVLTAATVLCGVLVGPPLVLAAYLRLQSRERWPVALGAAAGFSAIVRVVFELVLDLPTGGLIGAWWR
jgi:hypothetical protein